MPSVFTMQLAGPRFHRIFFPYFLGLWIICGAAAAGEPLRIWVDSSGRHSIKARWVERDEERVILQRADGKRLSIAFTQLSDQDQDYLHRIEELTRRGPNPLRSAPPSLPPIDPRPPLDLPPAETVAAPRAELQHAADARAAAGPTPAGPLAPDPAARSCQVPLGRTTWQNLQAHNSYSPPIPIAVAGQHELVFSVSGAFAFPADATPGRLVALKPGEATTRTAWRGEETIRLLDHHHDSGRSLALIGHNSLGEGGELAILTGWDDAEVTVAHRRRLPGSAAAHRSSHLHWARWIDEEHVVAMIDDSLSGWNVVSGEPLFHLEGVETKTHPALSKGRRYIALPRHGAVELYRSSDGKPLGKIVTEKDALAAVSFSPRGDALAIVTPRRLLIWELPAAAPRSDIPSGRALGREAPLWISDDLVMTSNGTLISIFRGVPLWRYDLAGATAKTVGGHLAVFREHPQPELATVAIPHAAARRTMQWIDSGRPAIDPATWQLPGRSQWHDGEWIDAD